MIASGRHSDTSHGLERDRWVGAWLVTGLLALLVLHVVEPSLPLTWSYAGLRAAWGSAVPGMVAASVVFLAVMGAWYAGIGSGPVPRVSRTGIVGATLAVWMVVTIVGFQWPAPDVCPDTIYLRTKLSSATAGNVRWLLAVPVLRAAFHPFRGLVDVDLFLRCINALFSALSMVLGWGIARRLGRSLREAVAVWLLVWTAFGSLQIALGYIDIYPLVQMFVALHLWAALRYFDREGWVGWPFVVATVGTFFYVGLILLLPSLIVVVATAYRRRELAQLVLVAAAVVPIVGIATVPAYGKPFALGEWLQGLAGAADARIAGLNPNGQTLPLDYMLSVHHAGEVLSALLLLDGTALVFLVALPATTRVGAFLLCLLAAAFAFIVAMDPLWGPYADWDLFSYLTLPLSVAAGVAFLDWSRRSSPGLAGVVLGLALATSTVHLYSRLNALHVDWARHMSESPYHIPLPPNVFKPSLRRSVP